MTCLTTHHTQDGTHENDVMTLQFNGDPLTSCDTLIANGWASKDDSKCSESQVNGAGCSGAISWDAADDFCRTAGGRVW